jgi:hypothetical protein
MTRNAISSIENNVYEQEIAMKSALSCAILSLLMCVPGRAYDVATGPVMVCDTQEQVERFVQLFDGNQQRAIDAVNSEEHNPSACAVVDVTYVPGPTLGVARSRSHAFEITPVAVVGSAMPRGYRPVKPVLFFTPISVKEFAV